MAVRPPVITVSDGSAAAAVKARTLAVNPAIRRRCSMHRRRIPLPTAPTLSVLVRQAHDVAARFLVALERERAARFRVLEQGVERAVAVIRLVESRLAAFQCLLHHRAPD